MTAQSTVPPLTLEKLFDYDLFTAVGLADAPEDERISFVQQMTETVYARVYATIADSLGESDQLVFASLADADIDAFLSDRGLDYIALITEAAVTLRTEIIVMFHQLQNGELPDYLQSEQV